jgi:hypothetical protein
MWVAYMKREMKLMIVSGYQLYKLYRYRLTLLIHALMHVQLSHCFWNFVKYRRLFTFFLI